MNEDKTKIERLIEEGTPFAVARYFSTFRINRSEGAFVYKYLFLKNGILKEVNVKQSSLDYLKNNVELFEIKIIDGGKVYDFNNFRGYFRSNATKNELRKVSKG